MIVTFAYPSSPARVGGVTMLYEFAGALAHRGHDVHFVHGPAWPGRIDHLDQLPFHFRAPVEQHIVDSLDDPSLPEGDVAFGTLPRRLGQPAVFVQGFRLIGPRWDHDTFRAPAPKICVASWLVEVGRWFGVPDEQLVHVPMGLDHDLFAVRTPLDSRPIDVAMLYHPSREKGWDVGLAALRELSRRRRGFRAVVFTLDGPPPEGLPPGVELVCGLDQRRLADEVYNESRVIVQSSHHEGFGLTAVEGMACGTALVTTDCGGSRDYAIAGETACVVKGGDGIALADAVDSVLSDDAFRTELASAGERFVRRFRWELSSELLEAFLERYLSDPGSFQRPAGEDRSEEYVL